jgi:hypothetical protein
MSNSAMMLKRREALRVLAACMADWWLPRQLFAQRATAARPRDRRVIVVTFGGGVRYEDTLAREGWVNVPHLASDIVPQGLVYPAARHEGPTAASRRSRRRSSKCSARSAGCRPRKPG